MKTQSLATGKSTRKVSPEPGRDLTYMYKKALEWKEKKDVAIQKRRDELASLSPMRPSLNDTAKVNNSLTFYKADVFTRLSTVRGSKASLHEPTPEP